jgi:dTDP-glucose 4,6-dehydratase
VAEPPIPSAPTRYDHPVVVTGGAGFVGREVVRLLAEGGCPEVRVVDIADAVPRPGGATCVAVLDIRRDDLAPAFRGAGTILHLAACQYHSTLTGDRYDLPFAEVNVGGTRRVLEAARAAGVTRVVYASSSMVYGVPRRVPIDDTHPCRPIGPYGRSKLEAERLVREAADGAMETVIVRPPPILGPGRLGAITGIFQRVLEQRVVPLIGDGRNLQDLIDCEDCARLLLAAGLDRSGRTVFNGGSAAAPTMRDWIAALIGDSGSRSTLMEAPALPVKLWLRMLEPLRLAPLRCEQYEIADRDYVLDIAPARAIGWTPRATGTEAALAAFRWYRKQRPRVTSGGR